MFSSVFLRAGTFFLFGFVRGSGRGGSGGGEGGMGGAGVRRSGSVYGSSEVILSGGGAGLRSKNDRDLPLPWLDIVYGTESARRYALSLSLAFECPLLNSRA